MTNGVANKRERPSEEQTICPPLSSIHHGGPAPVIRNHPSNPSNRPCAKISCPPSGEIASYGYDQGISSLDAAGNMGVHYGLKE
ncbi:hypothetical protein CDAR_482681 [Caerostris darwini]|uniref:Uncharacterized protein n=1 Tax=Caerostris darwini TaxID=1538125 RepID=A0AAV4RLF8_9ARAC|nr:hypothetical protein CDAR_482681 [Caerostris darwini]